MVQQRVFNSVPDKAFIFTVTDGGKQHLLTEGTDVKYGARHLKRAIERLVVQPLSNLIATEQVRGGDWIKVDCQNSEAGMVFTKEAEGLPVHAMAELVDNSLTLPLNTLASGMNAEQPKTISARSQRTR